MNRYSGEIRINPVPILRNDDFNNDGQIADINIVFKETLRLNRSISERITRLMDYLKDRKFSETRFSFSEAGYITMDGLSDQELLDMKSKGLIDVFDFATDKAWVKKYGQQFGLIWENGRAVEI